MPGNTSTSKLFKALMHPARLAILDVLRDGEQCVCHMEAMLGYRQAYVSQQLSALREAGLVADRRDGWNMYYRVIEPQVYDVVDTARRMMGDARSAARRKPAASAPCACPRCNAVGEGGGGR